MSNFPINMEIQPRYKTNLNIAHWLITCKQHHIVNSLQLDGGELKVKYISH